MSDKGEKTCPLCAEEMDLTDQQLKPCKCGYDICVWCWHHIMDMAEKDGIEGRCPACRMPYDKEKIVGMAASRGRVVADISTERKVKSQRTKSKPSEGRKHLSSVRVVQRNLVYVVGLPLNLGDEDLLQHKDYFGRYGKVLKASMSRTSTGAIQQFPNNTCSVYITYSKEEEAARCIQAVHGFTLDGRLLKACFGTTKYCHAWLRNMPCSNPDCLYLHEIGSQVDSFTKDEIVSAHTRVQEITGATTNLLLRSGNVLPPPLDENTSNFAAPPGKHVANNPSNSYPSLPSSTKALLPNGRPGGPASLPSGASWGARPSLSQPSMNNSSNIDAPGKQQANTTGVPMAFSSVVASTVAKSDLHRYPSKKQPFNDESQLMNVKAKLDSSRKKHDGSDFDISSQVHNDNNEGNYSEPHQPASEGVILKKSNNPAPVKSAWDDDSTDDDLCTSNTNASNGHFSISDVHHSADHISDLHADDLEKPHSSNKPLSEISTSEGSKHLSSPENLAMEEQYDLILSVPSQVSSAIYSEGDEDVRSFNIQRLNDSQVVARPSQINQMPALNVSNRSREMPIHMEDYTSANLMDRNSAATGVSAHEGSQLHATCAQVMSSGYNNYLIGENGYLFPNAADSQVKRSENNVYNGLYSAADLRENSIISDILSMDLESDGSFAAGNLARLFSGVDKPNGSQLPSTSWSAQSNNNQSRFSFARQEETDYQTYAESSNLNFRQPFFDQNVISSRNQYQDKVGHNSIGFDNFEDYDSGNQAAISSNMLSASRASPVSAPPGFSISNRSVPPPPPGFNSFERAHQTFNTQPGHSSNHSLFRSSTELAQNGNMYSNGDIEFMDPAILAVGKGRLPINGNNNYEVGMRSNFHSELDAFENEARLKLLMQRSLTPQRGFPNNFSLPNDTYNGNYAQKIEQQQIQGNEYSQFVQNSRFRNGLVSNGQQHHEAWRDLNSQHSNDITMLDLIMKERLGLNYNKSYNSSFEEAAFQQEIYNRSLGM